MGKVLAFALLLLSGLALSQVLPAVAPGPMEVATPILRFATFVGLAFIMIRVGLEFDIERREIRQYGRDYLVAMTAAAFPWILVTLYFVLVLLPVGSASSGMAWRETLLAGRFAAPTSAGVLFAMLAAAGLASTWVFQKARVLAVFDDIDTVLLLIPLKILLIGFAWQLGIVVFALVGALVVAWKWMHKIELPTKWPWLLAYAAGLSLVTEVIYVGSKVIDPTLPIHLEVLLPAFALGCVLARRAPREADEHAGTIVSGVFMVLVGLSLPPLFLPVVAPALTYTASQPFPGWGVIVLHVLAVTVVSNLGKMFPLFCYRREAKLRERLAVAIAMWPRGEVGAGVLVLSLGYGIGGPVLTVAMLSLALNLALTGVFILAVKRLADPPVTGLRTGAPRRGPAAAGFPGRPA